MEAIIIIDGKECQQETSLLYTVVIWFLMMMMTMKIIS